MLEAERPRPGVISTIPCTGQDPGIPNFHEAPTRYPFWALRQSPTGPSSYAPLDAAVPVNAFRAPICSPIYLNGECTAWDGNEFCRGQSLVGLYDGAAGNW
ncbi:hypothetical protein C2E23DRAFT_275571 [Lenzites betulinus]|nr:hypothetical protein C2E23DRAFT_275571 [Lenzites betulinus]